MIPVKIVSSVEIPVITEEVMKELLTKEILSKNPELNIVSIEFERRQKPLRIEAVVEATLGNQPTTSLSEQVSVTEEVEEEVELPPETPEIDLEDDEPTATTTVADLFEDDD